MQFGFTLKPEHPIERHVALTRRAEERGFAYGWVFDSHVLWREAYTLLTLMATAHDTAAPWNVRDEPRHARAVRHGIRAGDAQRDQRRAHGPRDRARRLGAAGPGQGADVDGDARRGGPGDPRPRLRPSRRVRGLVARARLGASVRRPALDRRLRAQGDGARRPCRGRRDDPAGRPRPDPLLRRAGPRRRARRRPRSRGNPGDGRCSRSRRIARSLPRTDALVPGPRRQSCRGPGPPLRALGAAARADGLHPRSRGLRLSPPRGGRIVERGVRGRRGDRQVLRPGVARRPHREAARACRRRRRPVQHLPDERRRGGDARRVRARHHARPAAPFPRSPERGWRGANADHRWHRRHGRGLLRGRRARRRRADRGARVRPARRRHDCRGDDRRLRALGDPRRHRRAHPHGAAVRRHVREGHVRDGHAGGRIWRNDDDRRFRGPVARQVAARGPRRLAREGRGPRRHRLRLPHDHVRRQRRRRWPRWTSSSPRACRTSSCSPRTRASSIPTMQPCSRDAATATQRRPDHDARRERAGDRRRRGRPRRRRARPTRTTTASPAIRSSRARRRTA